MCGITGFIDYKESIFEHDLLQATKSLRHRGGNGTGHFFEKKENYTLGLANERLSTIDPVVDSNQPYTSSCGNYTITFNGTIYNYEELRATFVRQGIIFKTQSDTEVLLECYKQWNEQLFKYIDGAFAFCILDRKRNQLFLARDTMGVKPLYWYKDERVFAFASEMHTLFDYHIAKVINTESLVSYFRYGYFQGQKTIYEGINNFKTKHYLRIDINSGNYLIESFENISKQPNFIQENEEDILKKIETLTTNSVLRRYTADVPIAVLLSGGYDSATVAAILQYNSTKKIKTFTLGFEDKNFNEAKEAKEIAKYLNTNHHEVYISNDDAVRTLELLPFIFDEPAGDSGSIPLAFILKEVNKHQIKVVLGAEGGDELFVGYENYKKAIWLNNLRPKLPKFIQTLSIFLAGRKSSKLKEALSSTNLLQTYDALSAYFTQDEINNLLVANVVKSPQLPSSNNELRSLLSFDQEHYLPNDLLMKSDRIAMYYGIDNRDSLLSTELVAYVNELDSEILYANSELKQLFKKIAHRYIPQHLIDRPKRGFSIPLVGWMTGIFKPYIIEYLSADKLAKHKLLNTAEVEQIKSRFFRRPNSADARKLWLLLQFQMWYCKQFN